MLTGDFYDLLSERGQASLRLIDNILIKESLTGPKQLWSFDVKNIDPLVEEDEEEDDMQGL